MKAGNSMEIIDLQYSKTNTYLIKGEKGSLLFDTGWAGTYRDFCRSMKERKEKIRNIDYILILVKKYKDGNCEDKEIVVDIRRAVDASSELRSKKELIESFIANVNGIDDVFSDWREFVKDEKEKELAALIAEENLKPDETVRFINNAFRDGELKTTGVGIDNLLPPMRRFGGGSNRAEKKQNVIEKLKAFFEKYLGIV